MFNNIADNINYIPNCIICGKLMQFYFSGFLKFPFRPKQFVYLKTRIEDNKIISINKKYPLKIDISSNEIISGYEILDKYGEDLLSSYIDFYKKCPTCLFQINFNLFKKEKDNLFPRSSLLREEMGYFLKPKIKLHIFNHYENEYVYSVGKTFSITNISNKNSSKVTYIYANNKYLNCENINLNKFNNLKKINNYIKTLLAFG